jgi:hypothetical protein
MPPTAAVTRSLGSTARIAAIPAGPWTFAGKNFTADADALTAANASVGVKTPGMVIMPHSWDQLPTRLMQIIDRLRVQHRAGSNDATQRGEFRSDFNGDKRIG